MRGRVLTGSQPLPGGIGKVPTSCARNGPRVFALADMSGDSFGRHTGGAPGIEWVGPGRLLGTLQSPEQPHRE